MTFNLMMLVERETKHYNHFFLPEMITRFLVELKDKVKENQIMSNPKKKKKIVKR